MDNKMKIQIDFADEEVKKILKDCWSTKIRQMNKSKKFRS